MAAGRSTTSPSGDEATGLLRFIDRSPTPFHAVRTVAEALDLAGFAVVDEAGPWPTTAGRHYLVRGGSLVAWVQPPAPPAGFRVIGAHTDSPNLRIKPQPDTGTAGYRQLGVEVYGATLRNSWLDRDLGLAGRVSIRSGGSGASTRPEARLVTVDRPLARIPQLAIHLDRGVNDGLKIDPQAHLAPVWSLGAPDEGGFRRFLAKELGVPVDDVLAWEVMFHDLTPSTLLGADDELVSAPRIDNLASCHAALGALLAAVGPSGRRDAGGDGDGDIVPVICLFDHEEIGSQSSSGADSTMLPVVLERIVLAAGGDREALHRALAASVCASADGAHATHPNYPERHEPRHHIRLNAGPVLKINSNVRYATDAESGAWFELACERAEVPMQRFVVRSDLPCGSTIGPVTAARLGIPTFDVGIPQLAMHSARELCGARDPALLQLALSAFLASS
jgi:aspartyl aminopeptidase